MRVATIHADIKACKHTRRYPRSSTCMRREKQIENNNNEKKEKKKTKNKKQKTKIKTTTPCAIRRIDLTHEGQTSEQ